MTGSEATAHDLADKVAAACRQTYKIARDCCKRDPWHDLGAQNNKQQKQ
jgi:hypothetical protein